jgi:hypothetical protein
MISQKNPQILNASLHFSSAQLSSAQLLICLITNITFSEGTVGKIVYTPEINLIYYFVCNMYRSEGLWC